MSKNTGLSRIVLLALISVGLAFSAAAQADGAQTTAQSSNQTATTDSEDNVTIQAGRTIALDVSQDSLTEKWAGFYGQISGNKVLGSASSNLYTWTASQFDNAEVIATPQSAPTPTGVSAVGDPNSFLGSDFHGVANASQTFNLSDSANVLGSSISTAAVNTFNSSEMRDDRFTTFLYNNSAASGDSPVYVAEGSSTAGGEGFDGSTVNYQLLAGVGDATDAVVDNKTFSFYLELD